MKITLTEAGKRFNRDWIFRHVNYEFTIGHSYAITGANGSGKSTLLQIISGAMMASEGEINYELDHDKKKFLSADRIYEHLSIAAPYLEVVEEMTPLEFLSFHQSFKPLLPFTDIDGMLTLVGLEKSANKQIRYFFFRDETTDQTCAGYIFRHPGGAS